MKCLVLGGSSWDTLIHVDKLPEYKEDVSVWPKKVISTVGGTGAGKALALDALGAETVLVTAVSNDYEGVMIESFYKENTNIKVYNLFVDKTETHTNIMHNKGDRLSIFTGSFTENPYYNNDIEGLIEDADVILLNINDFCRAYIPAIVKSGKLCIVDIHDYVPGNEYHQDFIDAADILVGSSINIPDKELFFDNTVSNRVLVILTSGSKGLMAMDSTRDIYRVDGYNEFEYIDSNGAGDSFVAGFTFEFLTSSNIGKSLHIGNITGGLACSSEHLTRLDLSYDDILSIYKKRSK